jgi:hypothetical protein
MTLGADTEHCYPPPTLSDQEHETPARDLTGRCGTCSFFVTIHEDEATGHKSGECMLKCWPAPLKDTATCAHHKARGSSWDTALKRKKAAGSPRGIRDDDDGDGRRARNDVAEEVRAPLPREIDIDMDQEEFRRVLRQVLREELGVGDNPIGDRWRGGELVLKPGKEGTQEKRIPLDQFFHKVVMLRDKLRVLEQKLNTSKTLEADEKVQMQQYITACYGSLTTFNVLFREREDWFVGQGGKDD